MTDNPINDKPFGEDGPVESLVDRTTTEMTEAVSGMIRSAVASIAAFTVLHNNLGSAIDQIGPESTAEDIRKIVESLSESNLSDDDLAGIAAEVMVALTVKILTMMIDALGRNSVVAIVNRNTDDAVSTHVHMNYQEADEGHFCLEFD